MSFGPEWLIPLFIIVLLFGAKKLPELANAMGRSIKEFKKAADEPDGDDAANTDDAATGDTPS